jgi:hypothetical protein
VRVALRQHGKHARAACVTTPSRPITANTTRVAGLRIAYFAAAGSMRAVFQCWAAAGLPMN